ncbi:methyltransferase LaeA [Xylariaceae sp. FL0804]|nr:methyltransferase LaeA [Xylariaceae sp. FL0804]
MAVNGTKHGYGGPNTQPPPSSTADAHLRGYYEENGRWYSHFGDRYLFPLDELELDKLDIFHKILLIVRQEQLHTRELPPNPRILDLGTGSGIWAIHMAEQLFGRGLYDAKDYPPPESGLPQGPPRIFGWDLTTSQPLRIPPAVKFEQRDLERDWSGVEPDSFDLIHIRMLAGGVESWRKVYEEVFRHLKPGTGVLEHVEIDFRPQCEGEQIPMHRTRLAEWTYELHEAMRRNGTPLEPLADTAKLLESLGFVDINHVQVRLPLNPAWPEDEFEREIGKWFNLGMNQAINGMTMAPLCRRNGWRKEQVLDLLEDVKKDIYNWHLRGYCVLHIWTACRGPAPVSMR